MSDKNNITKEQIWFGIFLIVLFIAGYFLSNLVLDRINQQNNIEDLTKKIDAIEKNVSPYSAKDNLNKVVVIQDFKNSTINNKETNIFTKKITVIGDLSKGYLYVKANVDDESLTEYDGIYMKLLSQINGEYQELGGHLIKEQTLETPKSTDYAEYLYDLSDIKYKKTFLTTNTEVTSGNWLDLLNSKDVASILGFNSTARTGNLIEVSLYYDCAEKNQCSVEIK